MDDIRDYITSHQLQITWKLTFEELKQFEADLSNIKLDLKNVIKFTKPKDLMQIQLRASNLKKQIKDSEVFSKYLVLKELAKLRFRDINKDNELHPKPDVLAGFPPSQL